MITRRKLFYCLAGLPPLLALGHVRADENACTSLDSLSRSQRSLRKSLGFKAQTSDERKCGDCAFFSAPSNGSNCGGCSLFGGGPVYASSVCNSWAKK